MSSPGDRHFGAERIEWFDGNLFDGSEAIPLEAPEIEVLRDVSTLDWSEVEPAKDLERDALLWGSLTMRLPMQLPRVGPHQLRGIEINPYAAELARVTIWIGEIQWMLHNGFGYARDPILKPLTNIETRDALIGWSDPHARRRGAR